MFKEENLLNNYFFRSHKTGYHKSKVHKNISVRNLQINELFLFAFTLLNNTFIIKNFVQRNVLFIKQTIEIVRSQIFIFPKHDEHYEHKHF